jgi:membrane-bound serine protease (ClpP class)
MRLIKKLGQLIYLILILLSVLAPLVHAENAAKEVLVVDIKGPVTPIMFGLINRSITEADTRNAEALIIRLDTPGGSIELTQQIIQALISADIPVVVYVWPPGAHAASAGTFITLAGHLAAMAPNTSIGAASPIDGGGAAMDEVLRAKIENILVADIKNLAERRGEKALKWAQQAITQAKAASATEALELGVIDFIAQDLDDLLLKLDGQTVQLQQQEVALATAKAQVTFVQATIVEELLSIITSPSIALLLISIGSLAIIYEIVNPGGYMSGIIGVICLLIGLYGVGQLPVNYAGLALILLGLALFGAELFVQTHGGLTAGGMAAFIIGALILFNTSEFNYQLPWPSVIGIPAALAIIMGYAMRKAIQARRAKPVTGQEGLIGAIGTVKTALDPEGTVFVWGERWHGMSEDGQAIAVGNQVEVIALKGLQLIVKKIAKS